MHNFVMIKKLRLRAFLVVMSLVLAAFSATTAHASVSQTVSYSQGIENTYPFTIPAGLSVSISLSISITGTVTITDPDGDVVATIGVSGPNSTPSTSEVTLSKVGTYNVSESYDVILIATPPALYGQPETITDSGTDEWSFVNPAPGNSGTFEVSSGISMSVETEGNISVSLSETSATITVTGAGIAPGESASADVTGEWSVSTSMDVHVPPETGAINVTTNLSAATFNISGPASFSGSGTEWTTTNAPVGNYSITYGFVAGYFTPGPQQSTLTKDGEISFSGTYVAIPTGTISVTTNLDSATFNISGPASYSGSGMQWTTTSAPIGGYSITFGEVEGYYTPASQSDTLEEDETISFDGTYVEIPTGTINVITNLDAATFSIAGPISYRGGGKLWSVPNAPVGDYEITYGEVEGYYTPGLQRATLDEGREINFIGTYVEIPTGAINVTTNMNAATFDLIGYAFLFSVGLEYQTNLDSENISAGLRQEFANSGFALSRNATVLVQMEGGEWRIDDWDNEKAYVVRKEGGKLNVYSVVNYSGSGQTWTNPNAHAGGYTIIYGNVSGYFTPESQTATLNEGEVINFEGVYIPRPIGNINVTTNMDSATFDIAGPDNYSGSGKVWTKEGAYVGEYTITYNAIAGYATPLSQTAVLEAAGEINFEGIYVEIPIGTINVATNLDAATFDITGPAEYSGSGKIWINPNAPTGDYTITYGAVDGYIAPEQQTATLIKDGEIDFVGIYVEIPTGTINVTTNLDAATFDITGPANYSGSGRKWTKTRAPLGEYTIVYNDVSGYVTPESQTEILNKGEVINFTGTYRATGTIEVTTNLEAATFVLTGPAEYSGSGTLWTQVGAVIGRYTITYGDVFGYITPPSETKTLVMDGKVTFDGQYKPLTGTINVTTNLDAATFDITGTANYSGTGKTWTKTNALVGDYEIAYGAVAGYATPASQTATLAKDGEINFDGTYEPLTGTINVTTNLDAATFDITGTANYSGTGKTWTKTNALVGDYKIAYGAVAGYATPASQTATLAKDGEINFDGTYVDLTPPTISSVDVSGSPARIVGDIITVTLRGEPSGIAYFDIAGVAVDVPMPEDPSAPGTYIGYYTAVAGKNVRDAIVTVHLTDAAGNSSVNNDKTASVITAPWDVNSDGSVDILDANAVGSNMGGNPVPSPGLYVDVNDDGEVNFLDLILVGLHFGEKYGENGGILAPARPLSQEAIAPFATSYQLLQNYPNPLNPDTWIPYIVPQGGEATISIYSLTGKLVRRLELGYRTQGFYVTRDRAAHWDGKNDMGEAVASGLYFYHIKSGDFSAVRKMLVAK